MAVEKLPLTDRPSRSRQMKQRLYKKYRLSGLSLYQSAKLAGYAESTARAMSAYPVEKQVKMLMAEQLDRAGLTDQVIAQEVTRIATKATKFQSEDSTLIEVPDEYVRLKALDLGCVLKGHKTESRAVGNNNTQVNIVVELTEEKKNDAVATIGQ